MRADATITAGSHRDGDQLLLQQKWVKEGWVFSILSIGRVRGGQQEAT